MTDISWEGGRFSPAWLTRRTVDLLRVNFLRVAVAFVAMTAVGTAADVQAGSGLFFLANVVVLVMQYWLTATLLDDLGLRLSGKARFPAFFVLGLVTGLGILVGLVLLIVPGIVLIVRWSIAVPAVISGEQGTMDSVAYSWRQTEGKYWSILATFLVLYAPGLAVAVGSYAFPSPPSFILPATIISELAMNAAFIAGWHGAIAIYVETRRGTGVSEVFA